MQLGAPLKLSGGELACVLGLLGLEQAALDAVQGSFAVANLAEAELVLDASLHSLLARGLLLPSAGEEYELAVPFRDAMELLASAERTLICLKITGLQEETREFHFAPEGVLSHSYDDDVVRVLTPLSTPAEAVQEALDFFAAPEQSSGEASSLVSEDLLAAVRSSHDAAAAVRLLIEAGAPRSTSRDLAQDLLAPVFVGAISASNTHKDARPSCEFQLVGGRSRLWVLHPGGPETLIKIAPASRDTLAELLLGLSASAPIPPRSAPSSDWDVL